LGIRPRGEKTDSTTSQKKRIQKSHKSVNAEQRSEIRGKPCLGRTRCSPANRKNREKSAEGKSCNQKRARWDRRNGFDKKRESVADKNS